MTKQELIEQLDDALFFDCEEKGILEWLSDYSQYAGANGNNEVVLQNFDCYDFSPFHRDDIETLFDDISSEVSLEYKARSAINHFLSCMTTSDTGFDKAEVDKVIEKYDSANYELRARQNSSEHLPS